MSDPDSSYPADVAPSEPGSRKPGSTIGDKIKGVARVIHGLGEGIRGYAMSVVDNTISRDARGADKNGEITRKGKLEVQRGLADMGVRGSRSSATSSGNPVEQRIVDSSSVHGANEASVTSIKK